MKNSFSRNGGITVPGKVLLAVRVFLRYNTQAFPGVAQLVARVLWEHEAASSSLATRTRELETNEFQAPFH